jgi:hypothetical protein
MVAWNFLPKVLRSLSSFLCKHHGCNYGEITMSRFLLSIADGTGESHGTLEIDYDVWSNGEASQNWEWMGGPENSDGGTWEWGKGPGNGIAMNLTSNLSHQLIGVLHASKWENGPIPPLVPWFAPAAGETGNDLTYFSQRDKNGMGFINTFAWKLKK